MSNKKEKKNTSKPIKKTTKNRNTLMLKFDNGVEIPARIPYTKDTKCFKINDIEINKIRVPEKTLYSKKHNSCKYYVFYEHDNEYVPLRIILKDVIGKYSVYRGRENNEGDGKSMGFKL